MIPPATQVDDRNVPQPAQHHVLLVGDALQVPAASGPLTMTAGYRLLQVKSEREVSAMRLKGHSPTFVVLSGTSAGEPLSVVARTVRAQWPAARIVVVGTTPMTLDDNLYDDILPFDISNAELLEVLQRLSDDPIRQRPFLVMRREADSVARLARPDESDPKKLPPSYRPVAKRLFDQPAAESLRRRLPR